VALWVVSAIVILYFLPLHWQFGIQQPTSMPGP